MIDADYHTKTDKDGNVIIDFSGLFLKNKDGKYFFGKGRHNKEEISKSHIVYLDWVANKSNFNNSTKYAAQKFINWLNNRVVTA